MITELVLDESVDEEAFILDAIDGPFQFAIEADWDLSTSDWAVTWAWVKGSDWADELLDLNELGNHLPQIQLSAADPRFVEELLNAPVKTWWWI